MWRRDPSTLLRVGRHEVSLWQGRVGALTLQARQEISHFAAAQVEPLREALQALWRQPAVASSARRVDVIVESAWLPHLLLHTGDTLWTDAQVDALARHRFTALHGPAAQAWQVQTSYLAGDSHGLAFGLLPACLEVIRTACETCNVLVTSLQPALAWGWNMACRTWPSPSFTGWWVWPEQDRTVLAWVHQGRLHGLNSALPVGADLVEAIRVEAQRQGLSQPENDLPVCVAAWHPKPEATDATSVTAGWTWLDLSAGEGA